MHFIPIRISLPVLRTLARSPFHGRIRQSGGGGLVEEFSTLSELKTTLGDQDGEASGCSKTSSCPLTEDLGCVVNGVSAKAAKLLIVNY